ncbi:MAG: type I methionyl aminopeptidase [Candidatus Aminicenantes bacterium RBG_13_59_9]|nr:MAG: type I methionyl aminopeptidase [Candidatus Aminicenantes bacterium RBG_13_59_9]
MIIYKTEQEIEVMRRSSSIVATVLDELRTMVKPGIRTRDLDEYAESRARELGGVAAFKGYRGFPAALCTSVNEEIVHGIPSGRVLNEGDIIGLDFGVLHDGFYGDATVTCPVGAVSARAGELIAAAEAAFYKGLDQLKEGNRISDVSYAIQTYVESLGFSVIRTLVGHGIGHALHEEPQVPNFGLPGRGARIRAGMTLAIEPMITMGDWRDEILDNGWTAVTRDRSLAAHFEHTVAVTSRGVEILSLRAGERKAAGVAGEEQHA